MRFPIRRISSILQFIGAGLVMAAGFAPISLWWALPIGIAIWIRAIQKSSRWRAVIVGSLLTSATFFLTVLHWSSTYVGWLPWVALAVFEAFILSLFGPGIYLFRTSRWLPIIAGGLFVADEALRSRVPWGGFGWARLAFSEPGYLTRIAALGGAPLLAFAIALLGGAVAVLVGRGSRRAAIALSVPFLLMPLTVMNPSGASRVPVAAIQGNVPRLGLDFNAQRQAVLDNHIKATRLLAGRIIRGEVDRPDVVIWPENASDVDPLHDVQARNAIDSVVADLGIPVLVGGVTESPAVRNVSILWKPGIGPTSIYVKQHLAPFGEYLPLRKIAERLVPAANRIVDMEAGTKTVTHTVDKLRLGDVICFEIIEDHVVRDAIVGGRANLLVVQTNSATFGRSPESDQQLAVSRERAIEHGRSIVSVSTSGRSALILPSGEVIQRSGFFKMAILQGNLPLSSRLTFADRLGALPEYLIAGLMFLALIRRIFQTLTSRR